MSDVVAGKEQRRADRHQRDDQRRVPRDCVGSGYSTSPSTSSRVPDPHGPALADPVHDRAEQHAPHHEGEHADVGEDRPMVVSSSPNSAPEIQRQHRGHGGEREHPDAVDPEQPRDPVAGMPDHHPGGMPDRAAVAARRPSWPRLRDSGSQLQAKITLIEAERRRDEPRRRLARGGRRTSRSPGPRSRRPTWPRRASRARAPGRPGSTCRPRRPAPRRWCRRPRPAPGARGRAARRLSASPKTT